MDNWIYIAGVIALLSTVFLCSHAGVRLYAWVTGQTIDDVANNLFGMDD